MTVKWGWMTCIHVLGKVADSKQREGRMTSSTKAWAHVQAAGDGNWAKCPEWEPACCSAFENSPSAACWHCSVLPWDIQTKHIELDLSHASIHYVWWKRANISICHNLCWNMRLEHCRQATHTKEAVKTLQWQATSSDCMLRLSES